MAMLSVSQILPTNAEDLREFATLLLSKLQHRDLKITKLEHQLAGLRQHRFGSSSEALDQLKLFLEDEEIAAAVENGDQTDKGDPAQTTARTSRSANRCPIICHAMKNFCRQAMHVATAVASSKPLAKMSPRNWNMYPAASW